MNNDVRAINSLNKDLYKCISEDIDTEKVILTDKQLIHMAEHHPEVYNDVLIELNNAISCPDFIILDEKHENTGLIVKEIISSEDNKKHTFIVLRICTNSNNGIRANSVISGWKISDKRLQAYLRNKHILYKRT